MFGACGSRGTDLVQSRLCLEHTLLDALVLIRSNQVTNGLFLYVSFLIRTNLVHNLSIAQDLNRCLRVNAEPVWSKIDWGRIVWDHLELEKEERDFAASVLHLDFLLLIR